MTTTASISPAVSTAMCRLRPLTQWAVVGAGEVASSPPVAGVSATPSVDSGLQP